MVCAAGHLTSGTAARTRWRTTYECQRSSRTSLHCGRADSCCLRPRRLLFFSLFCKHRFLSSSQVSFYSVVRYCPVYSPFFHARSNRTPLSPLHASHVYQIAYSTASSPRLISLPSIVELFLLTFFHRPSPPTFTCDYCKCTFVPFPLSFLLWCSYFRLRHASYASFASASTPTFSLLHMPRHLSICSNI